MQRRSDPGNRDGLFGNKRPGALLHPTSVRPPAPKFDKIRQDLLEQRLPILCIGSSAPASVAVRSYGGGAGGIVGVGLGAPRPQTAAGQISGCRRLQPIPRPVGRQVAPDARRCRLRSCRLVTLPNIPPTVPVIATTLILLQIEHNSGPHRPLHSRLDRKSVV